MSATLGSFPAPTWPPPPNYLPTKAEGTTEPFSAVVCPPASVPATATLDVQPSGTGELLISALTVSRNVATFIAAGGVAGRVYTLNFVLTDTSGRIFQTLVFLPVAETLAVDPPPVAPDAGFGSNLTWSA